MSRPANDTLHIRVEYFTGREEEEDVRHPYYVASCDEIVAVTEGRTWNELMANIKEMLAAALDEEDTVAAYNLMPKPRIIFVVAT